MQYLIYYQIGSMFTIIGNLDLRNFLEKNIKYKETMVTTNHLKNYKLKHKEIIFLIIIFNTLSL